jgi:hypothetical protein
MQVRAAQTAPCLEFSAQCSSTCEYNCLIYRTLGDVIAVGGGDADTDEGSYMTLFCETVFPTPEQAFIEHDSHEYGFDLRRETQHVRVRLHNVRELHSCDYPCRKRPAAGPAGVARLAGCL